jgi:hypothetical protein
MAKVPGVRVGSSSAVLICGPFHGLPGSNSGTRSDMEPEYEDVPAALLQLSFPSLPPTDPGADKSWFESGHPVSD